MRNTIRVYALALSIFVAVSAPVFAASTADRSTDTFFTRLKNVIIRIFDESKIVVPPG
jgi:hypothetical protein